MQVDRADLEDRVRALHGAGESGEAIELALSAYGPELLGFAVALLRDEHEAADAFADAVSELWTGLPSFRWEATFRAWAYTLVRHACFRRRRRPYERRRRGLSDVPPELSALIDRARTSTVPWLRTDVKDRVAALRSRLGDDDRALLTLRIDRGLAWTEIARIMTPEDAPLDEPALARSAAGWRKRFERIKDRLRSYARDEGLLG